MIARLRICLALGLTLVLLVTAHNAAAMRSMQTATGQMVLCTGTGPVTVYVDANGQPTSAPHVCPDCITLSLLAVVPPVPAVARAIGRQADILYPGVPMLPDGRGGLRASARAPPLAV